MVNTPGQTFGKLHSKKPINKNAAPELYSALAKATILLHESFKNPAMLNSKLAVQTGKEMADALTKALENK